MDKGDSIPFGCSCGLGCLAGNKKCRRHVAAPILKVQHTLSTPSPLTSPPDSHCLIPGIIPPDRSTQHNHHSSDDSPKETLTCPKNPRIKSSPLGSIYI